MTDFTEKYNDIGGTMLGGYGVYLIFMFYPAVVIAMQFGMSFFTSYDDALFPSLFVGLVVLLTIGVLSALAKEGSLTSLFLLIFLYSFTLGPFLQWSTHISTADYIDRWEYEQRLEELGKDWDPCLEDYEWPEQEPFPGFNWFLWEE